MLGRGDPQAQLYPQEHDLHAGDLRHIQALVFVTRLLQCLQVLGAMVTQDCTTQEGVNIAALWTLVFMFVLR